MSHIAMVVGDNSGDGTTGQQAIDDCFNENGHTAGYDALTGKICLPSSARSCAQSARSAAQSHHGVIEDFSLRAR